MKKIVIFSGTTEGRLLSEKLSDKGIFHTVSVASEYGSLMMEPNQYVTIHTGRIDMEGIKELIVGEDTVVVDATHPYAVEVTKNIINAARETGATYMRVIRDSVMFDKDKVSYFENVSDVAQALANTTGNVLLTTGSKELSGFVESFSLASMDNDSYKKRVYVRVLPSVESINLCLEAGISPDHIIAMHGPFTREMNEAVINQYGITHLVTKESGVQGGFEDKLMAAFSAGAHAYVVGRPVNEHGLHVNEALSVLTGCEEERPLNINLVGIGMGHQDSMTVAAKGAIDRAQCIFGATRLIQDIKKHETYDMYSAKDIIPVITSKHDISEVAILFSGDSGFFSGTKNMSEALKSWSKESGRNVTVNIYPGISSVSYLAARLGQSYDDASITSIHGRNDGNSVRTVIDVIKHNKKTYVLLSGAEDIRKIASCLTGQNCRIYAGKNLSYEDEDIVSLSIEEAARYDEDGIITALVVNSTPEKELIIKTLRDGDFNRDKVPMTKECIRHEGIRRLGLCKGDVLYDIGGGTGSVAIEAACLDASITVYTIEKKPEAIELIRKNRDIHGATNLQVVEGEAPDALENLELPDCVFIGGASGKIGDILSCISDKKKGVNYVITAVSLETVAECTRIINEYGIADADIIQMSVTDIKTVGNHNLMQAQNPIFIISFRL